MRKRVTRQERAALMAVEDSPLCFELQELLRVAATERPYGFVRHKDYYQREPGTWQSNATTLLYALNERAAPHNRDKLPKTPQQLGMALSKLAPGLARKGVAVSYYRHGQYGRLWTLRQHQSEYSR